MHWELIKLRKIHKLSKTDMIKLLGLKDVNSYTKREDGDIDFKLSEMFTIAKFFNKRIEEIFLPRYIGNTDKKAE